MRPDIAIAVVLLAIAGCDAARGPLERVDEYQRLANRHEVEQLLALYAQDAQMDFGPLGVLEGRAAIGEIHEYDRAIGTQLRFEDCRLEERTVTCRAVETNDWLRTAGIDRIKYTRSDFVFDDAGRIERVAAALSPPSAESMGQAIAEFDAWARANRADEYLALFRDDGTFRYGYDSGVRVLALLRQWREGPDEVNPGDSR